jgi:hypothetical protein
VDAQELALAHKATPYFTKYQWMLSQMARVNDHLTMLEGLNPDDRDAT